MKRKLVKFTESEVELIKKYFLITNGKEIISLIPNRSYESIRQKADSLGIKKPSKLWSKTEIDILHIYYGKIHIKELSKLLPNRKQQDIYHKAEKLGLKYPELFTEEEIFIIKKYYGKIRTKELIKLFPGKTFGQICGKAKILKLKAPPNVGGLYIRNEVNHNFFTNINYLSAYYAGLLAADGNISKNPKRRILALDQKDITVIEKFINIIEYKEILIL